MSFVRIWVHAVWATKKREPYLAKKSVRYALFKHIRENAKKKEIHLDNLNGWVDHCHATFSLSKDLSIKKTMQLIKGESSSWINKSKLLPYHFNWAVGYYAVSVSEDKMQGVKNYVMNQEEHHSRVSFEEESQQFMKRYGFSSMLGDENFNTQE